MRLSSFSWKWQLLCSLLWTLDQKSTLVQSPILFFTVLGTKLVTDQLEFGWNIWGLASADIIIKKTCIFRNCMCFVCLHPETDGFLNWDELHLNEKRLHKCVLSKLWKSSFDFTTCRCGNMNFLEKMWSYSRVGWWLVVSFVVKCHLTWDVRTGFVHRQASDAEGDVRVTRQDLLSSSEESWLLGQFSRCQTLPVFFEDESDERCNVIHLCSSSLGSGICPVGLLPQLQC